MLKKIKIQFMRFLVRTIGMTSDGIQMSFQHGFTSGKMLDYVYANKSSGRWIIGKWIDRLYLSHVGWRAIRQRKDNLVACLKEAVALTLKRQKTVSLIDVASGPAQYILEVVKCFDEGSIDALCRDYNQQWVAEGQKKAVNAGLKNVSFAQGDAFALESFQEAIGTKDIAVSSGFYDWIVDDELIKKSMKILFDVLRPGGYFVFTNQSGHVDLEMVESVFVGFNKEPLRMTIRPAPLMNSWAKEAGFLILKTVSDEQNYYSVTLARKE